MNIEPVVLTLPSVRKFISEISDAIRSKSVLVLVPDPVSRAMVARLLINRFDILRIAYRDIPYTADSLPAMWLSEQLGVSWPSQSTVKNLSNLLHCEGLPDVIHIRDFNTGEACNSMERERWLSLLSDWVKESTGVVVDRLRSTTRLCLVAKLKDFDFCPPIEEEGLSVHWWWGFPSSLEMRLACRIGDHESYQSEASGKWLELVLPALAGNDIKLAEYLCDDIFGSLEDIVQKLEEYAHVEGLSPMSDSHVQGQESMPRSADPPSDMWEQWSKGHIISSPENGTEFHPGLLASSGKYGDIEHRLWRGQAELLLPILNEIRIRICDRLTDAFGEDWPINPYRPIADYELEAVVDNPRGAEFGHIEYLLKYIPRFRGKTELLPLVSKSKYLRNEIAHYRPVTFPEFQSLWQENQAQLNSQMAS